MGGVFAHDSKWFAGLVMDSPRSLRNITRTGRADPWVTKGKARTIATNAAMVFDFSAAAAIPRLALQTFEPVYELLVVSQGFRLGWMKTIL
jgi:hypothetical protein